MDPLQERILKLLNEYEEEGFSAYSPEYKISTLLGLINRICERTIEHVHDNPARKEFLWEMSVDSVRKLIEVGDLMAKHGTDLNTFVDLK
jgi:hypothetical protein